MDDIRTARRLGVGGLLFSYDSLIAPPRDRYLSQLGKAAFIDGSGSGF